MRIHKEERKYLCPECGYKCKWVNQLKYHMTKHTGECSALAGCMEVEDVLGTVGRTEVGGVLIGRGWPKGLHMGT